MKSQQSLLCPSYTCQENAELIGIRQSNGAIAFLGTPVAVDRNFVRIAAEGRPPELRFRFAGPCAQGSCANWTGTGCAVAASISRPGAAAVAALPECGIRQRCRWFHQHGGDACAVCPEVVRGSELVHREIL